MFLSQTIPGGVWRFQWTTSTTGTTTTNDGTIATGGSPLDGAFPDCANVYQGDLAVMRENTASNSKFSARRLRYVEDY